MGNWETFADVSGRKLPKPEDFILIPAPDGEPPDLQQDFEDEKGRIDEVLLNDMIRSWSSWQAAAESAAGAYSALEKDLFTELDIEKDRTYARLKNENKGWTAPQISAEVGSDEKIISLKRQHSKADGRVRYFRHLANAYQTIAVTYASERKSRVERFNAS